MKERLRIGLLSTHGELTQSIQEQCLGARLAATHTRELWGSDGPQLELIERQVTADPGSVDRAASELVRYIGCVVLVGALSVPHS
ncbi:MAG: hypothetical protein GEU73_16120, partial [Chloroflexi bacterium]|nr:hypothetical protein [Chloroflexota bacterium]